MNIDIKALIKRIQATFIKGKATVEADFKRLHPPAELFSAIQMERHGITLALSHRLTQKLAPSLLLSRLSESEAILTQSCEILAKKTVTHNELSPASEWLLDNFYLIQEQIHAIRRHLPKGYGQALPQLAGGLSGYPRVYDIALEIIQHGDGRWDLESLTRFVTAYQSAYVHHGDTYSRGNVVYSLAVPHN